jgi:cell division protein FtsI/penicillin-binding protein 2
MGLFQGRGRQILRRSEGRGRRGTIVDRNGEVLAEDRRKSEGRSQKSEAGSQSAEPNGQLTRVYPLGETTACVTGFTGPGGNHNGGAGLELGMDSALSRWSRDGGLRLTIDADLQREFFTTLQDYVAATRAARGSAVVIAGATSEILALVGYPAPDPARARMYPPEVWDCRAVTQAFPVEAAIRWPEGSEWQRDAEALGFGRAIGIGLPDETAGLLGDTPSAARATLLQVVQAVSTLARDGRQSRPFLIANRARRRKTPTARESAVPDVAARELLTRIADSPTVVPDSATIAGGAEVVIAAIGVTATGGQRYIVGAMLDRPFAGYYTPETARQLVAELEQKVSIP